MSRVKSKKKARQVVSILAAAYGAEPWNWHTRQSPFQVLIGTVLSQRTRDANTDAAARALFASFPSAAALAAAPVAEIARLIRPANYYRTKARRIKEISRILAEEHGGKAPATMAELMRLPGVGRKTAACVMLYGHGRTALPVDTHVHRISNRLGLVETRAPEDTEEKLLLLLDADQVRRYNELMVKHGQTTCKPVGPRCPACPLLHLCDHGRLRRQAEKVASGSNVRRR